MDISELFQALRVGTTVIVGGGFLLSGVAKLRDNSSTPETFDALGVPSPFNRSWAHRSYPVGELLIGVGVLAAPRLLWWPVAALAAILLAALTLLVLRVAASRTAVECNCFGAREPITWRTGVRNGVLLAFAVFALISSPSAGSPLLEAPLLAFLALFTGGIAVALTTASRGGHYTPQGAETFEDRILTIPEELTYTDASGTHPLRTLVEDGPALLVYVSAGCGACRKTLEMFSDGERIGGHVLVRFMETLPAAGELPARPRIWDDGGAVKATLGMGASPAALLLAADLTIPANPVFGPREIGRLKEGIEAAIADLPTSHITEVLDPGPDRP